MARYHGPKCRICRREGVKLFLKGDRCRTAKCPADKRNRPPGMHGWPSGRPSDYSIHLREKQKCKRYYGVLETQFRRIFKEAERLQGNTGENLLTLLERRLDNVLTLCGFAYSRAQARQFINHGHVQVNGRKVDIPSYLVREGDVIRPDPQDKTLETVRTIREALGHPEPRWLEINDADLTLRVARIPLRDEVSLIVQDGLIVEFCSR